MSSSNGSPGTIACGSRAESRCVPFIAAPATCVTVPSGATSESRAIQFARVAFGGDRQDRAREAEDLEVFLERAAVVDEAEGVGAALVVRDVAPPHDRARRPRSRPRARSAS